MTNLMMDLMMDLMMFLESDDGFDKTDGCRQMAAVRSSSSSSGSSSSSSSTVFYLKKTYRKKIVQARTRLKRENVRIVQGSYKLTPQRNGRRDVEKLQKFHHPYKLRTRLKTYMWSY